MNRAPLVSLTMLTMNAMALGKIKSGTTVHLAARAISSSCFSGTARRQRECKRNDSLKSELDAPPIFVSSVDHIEAHFLICFLSLLIMRILQLKTGWRHSAEAIATTLAAASATYEGDNWWIFDHTDDVLKDIGATLGIDFSKRRLTAGAIRSIVGATKKTS